MSDIAKSQEVFHETVQEVKRLRKLQRRFQIEIIVAVGFICLVIGFLAGASWQHLRVKGKDSVIVVEPATKPLQATDAVIPRTDRGSSKSYFETFPTIQR